MLDYEKKFDFRTNLSLDVQTGSELDPFLKNTDPYPTKQPDPHPWSNDRRVGAPRLMGPRLQSLM